MSKERETLITDLSINAVDGFFYITQKLQGEIRELLTQKPEPLSDLRIRTCAVTLKARNICPLLLLEISELLTQPEYGEKRLKEIVTKDYLLTQAVERLEFINYEDDHLTNDLIQTIKKVLT